MIDMEEVASPVRVRAGIQLCDRHNKPAQTLHAAASCTYPHQCNEQYMGQARCLGPRSSDACSVAWKTRCRSALQAAPPTRASDNPERQMVRSSHLCRCSVSQRRPSGTWRRWAPGRVHGPQRERFLLIVLPIAWPLLAGEPRRALG
eukprot:CAMPEP_0176184544 /NCGR_PEP_ID=MMETSP0121_2-20121125/873_1 /TAXON_ID=160619 /ORGANISM="Kryptoperidinium foliaceum, Strain CCMP 1326" /LENGTH=146 /DNA_ID=CAMNT_0017522929 /DNA_START=217 /DNA_END=654 /DNA_ORIENTATION=+